MRKEQQRRPCILPTRSRPYGGAQQMPLPTTRSATGTHTQLASRSNASRRPYNLQLSPYITRQSSSPTIPFLDAQPHTRGCPISAPVGRCGTVDPVLAAPNSGFADHTKLSRRPTQAGLLSEISQLLAIGIYLPAGTRAAIRRRNLLLFLCHLLFPFQVRLASAISHQVPRVLRIGRRIHLRHRQPFHLRSPVDEGKRANIA